MHRLRLALSVLLAGLLWTATAAAEITVQFVDTGQGDSTIIHTPAGKTVLIDGGPAGAGATVVQHLRELEVEEIDLMVATHPHLDHIGGLLDVLEHFEIGRYMGSGVPHTTETYRSLVTALADQNIQGIRPNVGRRIRLRGPPEAVLRVLGPPVPLLENTRSDLNSNSVILHMQAGNVDFLFLGDAEPATLAFLLETGLPDIDVLKVAHHGSRHGTSHALLDAIQPRIAIISSGRDNRYNHPHDETLALLESSDARVYRTDQQGTITATTDGRALSVQSAGTSKPDEARATAETTETDHPDADDEASFYASRNSKIFHRDGCSHVERIQKDNLISFDSKEDAMATGRRPGRNCAESDQTATPAAAESEPKTAEPGANATPQEGAQASAAPYYASRNSEVFHPRGCQHIHRINDRNLISFASKQEAIASGRRPGRNCRVSNAEADP